MAGKKGKADAKTQAKGDAPKAAKGAKGKAQQDPGAATVKKKKGAQAIKARHILCEKHSQREAALAELRDGEDWQKVCEKYSTEKVRSGGSLGDFKNKGELQPEFEEAAYALDTVDEHKKAAKGDKAMASYNYGLCKTVFGYHIIVLEAKK